MGLRPYQVAAVEALRELALAGRRRIVLTIPTGGGKTITAAEIIRSALSYGRRVLFVVHLRELIDQTARALASLGVERFGVMRGDDERVDPDAPLQIASIQTLARRKNPPADIVILDEAHRSLADTYVKNIWDHYTDAIVIGLTATPCRGDGRPLRERYEALVVGARYSELIASGHVSEPIVYAPKVEPDLTGVRKVAGDWDEGELEREMMKLAGDLVQTWLEVANGRTTVVFATSIAHSKDIVRRFTEAGISSEHLDGTTPAGERADILERLRTRKTLVVSNCAVLTEGFDMPAIRCAVIARPTMSLVLHMQTAGRALRPGVVQPIIMDHAGNVARHGFPHEDRNWTIDGPDVKPKTKNTHKVCPKCFVYIPVAAKVCPYCEAELPKPEEKPLPVEGKAQMVAVSAIDVEREFFNAQALKAWERGFKPGFAAAKFKEKFGRWPPWAWSEGVKKQFAYDEEWQGRVMRREREREYWKEMDAKHKARAEEPAAAETSPEVWGEEKAIDDW